MVGLPSHKVEVGERELRVAADSEESAGEATVDRGAGAVTPNRDSTLGGEMGRDGARWGGMGRDGARWVFRGSG